MFNDNSINTVFIKEVAIIVIIIVIIVIVVVIVVIVVVVVVVVIIVVVVVVVVVVIAAVPHRNTFIWWSKRSFPVSGSDEPHGPNSPGHSGRHKSLAILIYLCLPIGSVSLLQ